MAGDDFRTGWVDLIEMIGPDPECEQLAAGLDETLDVPPLGRVVPLDADRLARAAGPAWLTAAYIRGPAT